MADSKINDWQDVPVDDWQDVPLEQDMAQSEAFRRGVAEGGTFGFSGEAGGAVQAGLDILGKLGIGTSISDINKKLVEQGFKGDVGPVSTGDVYSRARQEEEQALKQAEELYPKTTLAGEVLGGIPTMAATGGTLGLTGTGIKGGIKSGAILGGITGAGKAEDISDIPSEALLGAGTGAAFGVAIPAAVGAVKGIGSAVRGLADLPTIQNIIKSRQYGKAGESLLGSTAETEAFGKLQQSAKGIISKINSELERTGKAITKAKDEVSGDTLTPEEFTHVKQAIETARQNIKKMIPRPELASEGEQDSVKAAFKLLDDYSSKIEQRTIKTTTFKPDIEKVVEAKPSTIQKLTEEAGRLTEQAKLEGKNDVFSVIETTGADGRRYANLIKLEKNQGHVVAPSLTEATPEESIREGIKVKTLLSEPARARTSILQPQSPIIKELPYETKVPLTSLSKGDVTGLEKTARQYSTYGEEALKSPGVAGEMTGLVKSLEGILPESVKEARKPFSALKTTEGLLGIQTKGTEADIAREVDKLSRYLAASEKEGLTPAQRSATLTKIEETIKQISPELAEQFQNARTVAEKYDLIQKAKKTSLLGRFTGGAVGAAVGSGFGGIGGPVGAGLGASINPTMLANIEGLAEYKLGKTLSTIPGIKSISNIISTSGSAGKWAAEKLSNATTKDEIGRNALLFSIQQSPEMRKLIKDKMGIKDDEQR